VLQVTFRDLTPSNATYLSDLLTAKCGGAPSGCMDDIRRELKDRLGLAADDDSKMRVSMLSRPQVRRLRLLCKACDVPRSLRCRRGSKAG
jgi:hypothetical protein